MAKKILTDINLNGNQIRNVSVDNVQSLPNNAVEGRIVYLTQDDGSNEGGNIYVYDGEGWSKAGGEFPFADITEYNEQDVITDQSLINRLKAPNAVVLDDGWFYRMAYRNGNNGMFLYVSCADELNGFRLIALQDNGNGGMGVYSKETINWPIYYNGYPLLEVSDNPERAILVRDDEDASISLRMNPLHTTGDTVVCFPASSGTLATEESVRNVFVWTEWS